MQRLTPSGSLQLAPAAVAVHLQPPDYSTHLPWLLPQEFAELRRRHAAAAAAIRAQLRALQRGNGSLSKDAAFTAELRLRELVWHALAELESFTQLKADVLLG